MPSRPSLLQASDAVGRRDEAALYWATGAAIAAALLAAGAGTGSTRVGVIGAGLGCTGVLLGWHTRGWSWPSRLTLGLVAGVAAAAALHGLIAWEMNVEASGIYRAIGEVGLTTGLRMAVLLTALSFLLVIREMLPFSLVPGLTVFGLVGGRGDESIVLGCFVVFLITGLAAVAQAMLLSGAPTHSRPEHLRWQLGGWRKWHWMTVGILIAAIFLLAYLLFIPVTAYATQYRWPLQLVLASDGFGGIRGLTRPSEPLATYPVGRGPVAPAEIPVLSIEGPPADLWRGEAFGVYTGTAWTKGEAEPSAAWIADDVISLAGLVPMDPDARVVTHTVRAEADMPLICYSPGQVRRVRLGHGIPRHSGIGFRVDKYGCLMLPGATFRRGASYEVTSVPLEMGPGPRAGRSPRVGLGDAEETYLRIPLGSRRVADLARRVAGEKDTDLDKLAALAAFVQENCVYTLDAPAVPAGEDAADHFLFRQKRGYCDLFATSLAVMARAVGIPTRLVVGYAGGSYDEESGRYIIRESDAHAWVEAYLRPWGWVNVDATPANELPPIPPFRSALLRLRFFHQDHPAGAAALGLGALAALVAIFVLRWRAGVSARARLKGDARDAVIWAYDQLCRLFQRQGRPRRPWQTPLEFLDSLEGAAHARDAARRRAKLPADSLVPARGLTEAFLRARYGPGPLAGETAALALQHLGDVRRALRRGNAPRQSA